MTKLVKLRLDPENENTDWLCCDRHFYVRPEPDNWHYFDDITRIRTATGLEPKHMPMDVYEKVKYWLNRDSERAYNEVVAAMLRGEM